MSIMTTERERARLEYLSSQEPGDASQATAIEIVDRLLEEADIETSQKISIDPMGGPKSAFTLGSKVAQCLAKRVECSSPLGKAGVFDWDDNPSLEDCITRSISRGNQRVHVDNQINRLDSQRCGGYGLDIRAGVTLECIDEDSGMNCLKKSELAGATDDLCEAYEYDIGPNTQMAAEAMEALFNVSAISNDVSEDAHPESSVPRVDLGEEIRVDKICSVWSSTQKQKLTCLRRSSGKKTTQFKQLKLDNTESANGSSSISSTKRPSMLKPRKNPKQMTGKTKRSRKSGIIHEAINHEVSEVIMGSGADDSDYEASGANSADAFDGTTATASQGRVIQNETSHTNQLEGTLSAGEKRSKSEQKDHASDTDLMSRVPLTGLKSTRPQSKTRAAKKSLNLRKSPGSRELASLFRNEVSPVLEQSRRRKRHMSTVRVLFSQSLDSETIKNQTKILIYFGLPVATTISEATHFVAEKFARTRNMLEAIALGIPVVTPSWLECCGEARCFIYEKKHILRDTKKEKELGFRMPVSLSRACTKPLLAGKRVLITPNAKPGKEILKSLVMAARGKPLERTTSMAKNNKLEGDFVISCEQDRSICLQFIKKGLQIFDSELLLNGIVTQKLEFERYRLFRDETMRNLCQI